MTDYAKAKFSCVYSEDSGYIDEEWHTNWDAYDLTPDEGETFKVEAALAPGTTISFSYLSAATLLAIKNESTVNFITVTWTDSALNANTQKVPAKGLLVIPDLSPATSVVLTANVAVCTCKICILGT